LNKKTGEIIWKKVANVAVPKVKRHTKSTHANPTPVTNGEFVVAFFGSEGLYCYKDDGTLVWKKDLGKLDSGWFYDADYQWGFAASPIIYKDTVIIQCDIQEDSFIAAYDLKSGSEKWRKARKEIPSWSSPTVVETSAGPLLVTNATKFARAYDPKNGEEIWRLGNNSEIAVPTPFVAHDLVFIASGYRPIQPIYAVKADARGDLTDDGKSNDKKGLGWAKRKGGPYMPTPICYGDYLYICSNRGVLSCYQATSGKLVYKNRISSPTSGSFVGSPVAADGHLYFPGETGNVIVVKAGPNFEKVAENEVGENILSVPAISEGVFYVRAQNHVFAFAKDRENDDGND
jgi:outer membrane protein assembly factor BamB